MSKEVDCYTHEWTADDWKKDWQDGKPRWSMADIYWFVKYVVVKKKGSI